MPHLLWPFEFEVHMYLYQKKKGGGGFGQIMSSLHNKAFKKFKMWPFGHSKVVNVRKFH